MSERIIIKDGVPRKPTFTERRSFLIHLGNLLAFGFATEVQSISLAQLISEIVSQPRMSDLEAFLHVVSQSAVEESSPWKRQIDLTKYLIEKLLVGKEFGGWQLQQDFESSLSVDLHFDVWPINVLPQSKRYFNQLVQLQFRADGSITLPSGSQFATDYLKEVLHLDFLSTKEDEGAVITPEAVRTLLSFINFRARADQDKDGNTWGSQIKSVAYGLRYVNLEIDAERKTEPDASLVQAITQVDPSILNSAYWSSGLFYSVADDPQTQRAQNLLLQENYTFHCSQTDIAFLDTNWVKALEIASGPDDLSLYSKLIAALGEIRVPNDVDYQQLIRSTEDSLKKRFHQPHTSPPGSDQ